MPFISEDEDTDAEESNAQQGELVGKDYCTAKKLVYTTLYNILISFSMYMHCMHIGIVYI